MCPGVIITPHRKIVIRNGLVNAESSAESRVPRLPGDTINAAAKHLTRQSVVDLQVSAVRFGPDAVREDFWTSALIESDKPFKVYL
jgi:hypothetical protein